MTAHRPGPAHANPEALPWVFLRMFTSPTASAFMLTIALVVVW